MNVKGSPLANTISNVETHNIRRSRFVTNRLQPELTLDELVFVQFDAHTFYPCDGLAIYTLFYHLFVDSGFSVRERKQ